MALNVDIRGMAKASLNLPYLLLSGSILIGIIVSFVIVRPQYLAWRATSATIVTTQEKITERRTFLLTIDRKKVQLQGEGVHEKQLAVVLPADESLDDVARILHTTGEAAGLIITRINNNGEGERARIRSLRARGEVGDIPVNVEPIGIEVQLSGNYQQVRQFIERLERAPRLMDITSLKITRNATNLELLNVDLRLRIYEHEKGASI